MEVKGLENSKQESNKRKTHFLGTKDNFFSPFHVQPNDKTRFNHLFLLSKWWRISLVVSSFLCGRRALLLSLAVYDSMFLLAIIKGLKHFCFLCQLRGYCLIISFSKTPPYKELEYVDSPKEVKWVLSICHFYGSFPY